MLDTKESSASKHEQACSADELPHAATSATDEVSSDGSENDFENENSSSDSDDEGAARERSGHKRSGRAYQRERPDMHGAGLLYQGYPAAYPGYPVA